jgi:hypothetical protein
VDDENDDETTSHTSDCEENQSDEDD